MWLIASVAIAAGAEGVLVGTEPSETTFLPILLLLQDDRCNDYSVGRHNAPQTTVVRDREPASQVGNGSPDKNCGTFHETLHQSDAEREAHAAGD